MLLSPHCVCSTRQRGIEHIGQCLRKHAHGQAWTGLRSSRFRGDIWFPPCSPEVPTAKGLFDCRRYTVAWYRNENRIRSLKIKKRRSSLKYLYPNIQSQETTLWYTTVPIRSCFESSKIEKSHCFLYSRPNSNWSGTFTTHLQNVQNEAGDAMLSVCSGYLGMIG